MKSESFTYDVCGTKKQTTNHWFKVRVGEALHIYRWDFFGEGADYGFIPIQHVCGSDCATKVLNKFLGG